MLTLSSFSVFLNISCRSISAISSFIWHRTACLRTLASCTSDVRNR